MPASNDPEAFLKTKGLLRVDPFFVLADERDVYKQMSGLDKLKKGVVDGTRQENKAEKDEDDKKALIVTYIEQRARSAGPATAKPARECLQSHRNPDE